jgi:hypothetical protein
MSQAPQLLASLLRFVQRISPSLTLSPPWHRSGVPGDPAHSLRVSLQVVSELQHLPSWQMSLPDAEQSLPQPPQFRGSSRMLVHLSPHASRVLGLLQVGVPAEHSPKKQVSPSGQTLPHPLQFLGSRNRLTHSVPQTLRVGSSHPPL